MNWPSLAKWGRLVTLVLFAGVLTSQAAAGPQPVDRPLTLTATQGLFAISFDGEVAAAHRSSKKQQRRVVKAFDRWSASLVSLGLASELPNGNLRKTQRRLAKLFSKLVKRQQSRRESPLNVASAAPQLNALTLAAGVSVVGLTLEEDLSVAFTLEGNIYDAALDTRVTQAAGEGVTLQIDYTSAPPSGELDGSIFAALIRDASAPSAGLLVVGIFDSALPELLEPAGATNSDAAGDALSIPFDLTLSGSVSGSHVADDPGLDVLYFAVEDLIGIGVSDDLAEAAESLIAGVQ